MASTLWPGKSDPESASIVYRVLGLLKELELVRELHLVGE